MVTVIVTLVVTVLVTAVVTTRSPATRRSPLTPPTTVVSGDPLGIGYKRTLKIRPKFHIRPNFGFLFNRTEPVFQKFGFG